MVIETPEDKSIERYSFSKLSTWWTCPYGYYQRYIEHKAGIGNAFASFGTFVHELMEKYAKGEAELWDLPQIYEWQFDTAVPEKFPYNKYVNIGSLTSNNYIEVGEIHFNPKGNEIYQDEISEIVALLKSGVIL